MRLIKILLALVVLAALGLTGYAYFGDMESRPREMRVPVPLDLGAIPDAPAADTPAPAVPAPATEQPADATNLD
ncbi:MAG: hypothetical protein Q4G24_12860 [Paracoccus sp. (in: a-proteobacteria)]|uniref:hypothetical protein n=1 Tax=Paracoccus sp. TaxID=267 RepID=UPI0026DEE046|nr:hypothetical protein [Paracoccus sp. (in: a-proteobacteria)]MDO5622350.1 hypothetical protein [Paracoccus sp. (in: a-proteobacteria)]